MELRISSSLIHHSWILKSKTSSENQNKAQCWFLGSIRERLQLVKVVQELSGLEEREDSREKGKPAKREKEREKGWGERRGWRNALRTNGCLETVVKETMSPRVLWHLNRSWIFIQILGGGRLFISLPCRLLRHWFVTERKGELFKVWCFVQRTSQWKMTHKGFFFS